MSDSYLIDGHKLTYHPREVARWMRGEDVFPLYVEISPAGGCNHRCVFCALDYLGYAPRFLDTAVLRERLSEMGRLGVRSVLFGGEGEPLLHKDLVELAVHAKGSGIDVALTTNGVLLSEPVAAGLVPVASWIKVSLNAGDAATYAALHRTRESDFELVLANIARTASLVASTGAGCAVGVQAILLPENAGGMETLAARARDAGADYLVVKSYSQHGRSVTRRYERFDYSPYLELSERLGRFATDRFKVIVRTRAMRKLSEGDRGYDRCLALPFWAYVDSGGGVWGCSAHLGDDRFRYGSLCEQAFAEIWLGEKRRRLNEFVSGEFDPAACRRNCRMDEVNRYLWSLRHPPAHVNFI